MKNMKLLNWLVIVLGMAAVASLARLNTGTGEPGIAVLPAMDSLVSDSLPIPDTTAWERLQFKIDELCDSRVMHHATWGFYLYSVDSGKIIANFNEHQSMVPASVMKIITTGVALAKAGPNYNYVTRLQYDGNFDMARRTLNGNIYIKGGGDPTLGSDVFGGCSENVVVGKWLRAIQKLGIDTINGAIVGDARLYDYNIVNAGWAWEDMQSDYCAGACGLSFHENMYDLSVCCIMDSMRVRTNPVIPGLRILNNLVIRQSTGKSYCYIAGAPYVEERYMFGLVSPDSTDFVAKSQIPDPPFLAASSLLEAVKRIGIYVKDSATTVRRLKGQARFKPYKGTTFHSLYSPPLRALINYTNSVSHNFYAETILKTLAVVEQGYGSSLGGATVVHKYLQSKGINTSGLYMVDGCGLSRYNAVTPKMLCEMLVMFATDSSYYFDDFYNSLPIAGKTGTLRKLCIGTAAEGNVRAKSGTMGRVRAYAGYVHTKKGELLAFSMIGNNHAQSAQAMRDDWEELMVLMAELDVTSPL